MTRPLEKARMRRERQRSSKWVIVSGIVAAAALLVLANAHLVYVAFTSQPECVEHPRGAGETSGSLRAAKPAC